MQIGQQKSVTFDPVGIISSCYKEKFGIPRQAGLVTQAPATLELLPPYQHPDCVRELAEFSHIWLIFVFHQNKQSQWSPTVRPPRLGGNRRVGVFASRSPFRPNPIGMSLVELASIEHQQEKIILHLYGADLVDQTPVLDIKPYIPYADCVADAQAAYANSAPKTQLQVVFSEQAEQQCQYYTQTLDQHLSQLIVQILQCDPRPAYKRNQHTDTRTYAMKLYNFDLHWRYTPQGIEVVELK
jgi:tRNA-Thr(GGU) m(6)t(6)A37 methyltransferase TsaA